MRILHVVHQYVPDHVAGTELYTQMVARRQLALGHETAVFTPLNREGPLSGEPAEEEGVRVYRVPVGPRSATNVFLSVFRQAMLARAFAAVLAAERPDIVHLQHLMGVPAAVGETLCAAGVPYVMSLHDYWYGCANGQLLTNDTEEVCGGPDPRYRNCGRCAIARAGQSVYGLAPLVAPLMRRRNALLRPIYERAARVLAPNEFVRRIYAEMGLPTGHVVINPLGLDAPPDLADRLRERRAARTPGGLRLGYVGSISRQKGVHVLIEAVNALPAGGVSLDIYGDMAVFPQYAAELRALAAHPGIRFNGLIARGRIWEALADLDVLVMPTLWYEGSPAIIREAFAAGLPLVGSAIGATGSMVRHGIDGLLFPAGDAAALRETLRPLIDDPAQIARLRAGIAPVRTVADHVAQIDATYREVRLFHSGDTGYTPRTLPGDGNGRSANEF